MRILEILENDGGRITSSSLCYLSLSASGELSLNGRKRSLHLLPPGRRGELQTGEAALVLSAGNTLCRGSLSTGEVFLSIHSSPDSPFPLLVPEEGGFLAVSQRLEFLRPFRAAILTVSDKGSRGEREDTSGPALARMVRLLGAEEILRKTVPDEIDRVASVILRWSDTEDVNLILTTGGTGFSQRDITPEALERVGERSVPGIGEAMRRASLKITPRAILSRSNAVLRKKSLIISLPGSEKGAVECFSAVAPALLHGLEILCGWSDECAGSFHSGEE
ncbi:MAG: MogA/MoaB family molybdenum cofactor biosynthesis protein [Synergistaceae bacterium]|nr:MogA/MoaB family molybdenum cofactor biosynthesis protein [Synergistaceae bacterium]